MEKTLFPAFGYLRTSSATNVGEDKDSDKRQRVVIEGAAKRAGYSIREWFYDADVRGDVEVNKRPAFMQMLSALAGNGVRTVFIEDLSRFSRVATVGMLGIALLRRLDVSMFDGRNTNCTDPQDPMAKAMLGMMLIFAELDKDLTTAKLKGARDRKSLEIGRRIEGRKGYTRGETHKDLVMLAKDMRSTGTTFDAISAALAERGHLTNTGKPFSASQVKRIVEAGPV
jgi:DNA invertase Pin-like site-specific DNA recombinase